MAKITKTSTDGYVIGWGVHPSLNGLDWESRMALILKSVQQAKSLCGVTDIADVIPSGWNNGIAGPLREAKFKGRKNAYYPVYEMLKNAAICEESADHAQNSNLDSATLYEAESVIAIFS